VSGLRIFWSMIGVVGLCISVALAEATPRSPYEVVFSPDGESVAVSDHTAGAVAIIDVDDAVILRELRAQGSPAGLAWSRHGRRLYVTEHVAGSIAEFDPASGVLIRRLRLGGWPLGVSRVPKSDALIVADAALASITPIDLDTFRAGSRRTVQREPFAVAVTPDGSMAVVSNHLPGGRSTDPRQAAAVSLVELATGASADVQLPAGSSNLRDLVVDRTGQFAFVSHTLGRTNLPTSQIERGWINTNAVSIVDVQGHALAGTFLLDDLLEGAANPWGLAIAPDGGTLWVAISGTHEVAAVDVRGMLALLESNPTAGTEDLAALSRQGLITRLTLPGNGPRGLDVSPDGSTLAVAMYFSGSVVLIDTSSMKVRSVVQLPGDAEPTIERRGERIFHDATYTKQGWLSCATCHTAGRADGMNWDLLNDGLGNPKNAKSLVWSDRTPPVMSRGVRASMEVASAAGFRHISFQQIDPEDLEAVQAYLRSLEPASSPYLEPDGSLSPAATRGKTLFESARLRCTDCHAAPLYTNLKSFNVGTRGPLDRVDGFDTPTLAELWRTAPYLHDGSAATLREVLVEKNPDDKHGVATGLSDAEIEDLIAYLLSL
jgi:DNA-binding beta-propeller fold protein YncE